MTIDAENPVVRVPDTGSDVDPELLEYDEPARRRHQLPPLLPALVVGLIVLVALVGPILSPYGETEGSLARRLVPPLSEDSQGRYHLLGTDSFGRDIATRIAYGARVSLVVGVVGVALACAFGSLVGIAAGTIGRFADSFLMRFVDVALSIPGLLVAILLAAVFTPSIYTVFAVIGLLLWPTYARLVRGEVLALRETDYVALARVSGCSTATIARRHILPNVVPSITVLATLHIGVAIIAEAAISFLGVGLPATQASWGGMVSEGRGVMTTAWWLTVFPGVAIFLAVLSFNRLGDWARVRFDPRLNEVA